MSMLPRYNRKYIGQALIPAFGLNMLYKTSDFLTLGNCIGRKKPYLNIYTPLRRSHITLFLLAIGRARLAELFKIKLE